MLPATTTGKSSIINHHLQSSKSVLNASAIEHSLVWQLADKKVQTLGCLAAQCPGSALTNISNACCVCRAGWQEKGVEGFQSSAGDKPCACPTKTLISILCLGLRDSNVMCALMMSVVYSIVQSGRQVIFWSVQAFVAYCMPC